MPNSLKLVIFTLCIKHFYVIEEIVKRQNLNLKGTGLLFNSVSCSSVTNLWPPLVKVTLSLSSISECNTTQTELNLNITLSY